MLVNPFQLIVAKAQVIQGLHVLFDLLRTALHNQYGRHAFILQQPAQRICAIV